MQVAKMLLVSMGWSLTAKPFEAIRLSAARLALTACCVLWTCCVQAAPLTINVVGVGADGKPLAAAVTDYRWTVEEDATKLSIPGQNATPANYSFSFHTSYMPVVAAGRVGTEKLGNAADPDVARLYNQTLPDLDSSKRFYVSVAADGFQMGGAPVVFSGAAATATVYVNQYALPTAQVSVFAFEDNSPINGAPDLPQETGLAGFTVVLLEAGGTYGQSGGQVTQDAFANPLGTTYNDDGSVAVRGNGIVLTGPDGTATIKNLFPAKYTVVIVPPVGSDWHQTSTIEGTRGQDAWVKNDEPSFFQEFGPPGHHVFIGFTKSGCILGTAAGGGRCVGLTGGTARQITGRIVNIHNSRPPLYDFKNGSPVPECWVGLNEANFGRALYAAPCKKDSTFTIPNVPAGTYELVVWDEPLDMIIGATVITVGASNLALGDVPVFSWFARYQGRVFQDIDGTGLPFFAAPFNRPYIEVDPVTGIEREVTKSYNANDLKPPFGEGIASNIRFRDGSIYQSTSTKKDGTFAFTELFPFFNWMIAEIDYARFKATSATIVVDGGGTIQAGGGAAGNDTKLWKADKGLFGSNDGALSYDPWTRLNPQLQQTCSLADVAANMDTNGNVVDWTMCWKAGDKYYRTEQGVILLEGMQTFLGQTNHIEWGKLPYAFNENGGIAGIVHYAITRAEDEPRFAAAENWEPGIPRVQVNLFLDCDGDGKIDKPKNDGSGQCAVDGLSTTNSYAADLPDVDNYPFCWRDPVSCGLTVGVKGPEDIKRSLTGGSAFSYGDVFSWGTPGGDAASQLHTGLGKTDSWDDSIPTGCAKNPVTTPVSNGGIPFASDLDCFDGLFNFNQVIPAVFDGGYAFGRVAGQAELPMLIGVGGDGKYIVEAVAPPGYLHQGNGDKNVVFGDALRAANAALPFECVGMELDVPQYLTLFPGEPNPNFGSPQYPGNKWRKCDMKAVQLVPGTNPAPDFFMFTEAPVAGHGVGFILDDTASEFNRFAPTFGEKYAPPHLPISIQDWAGREISRVYSDQFGSYNFLVPSSFTINPPFPSGVMPSMMVACMNHPGPVDDTRQFLADGVTANPTFGQKVIDPFFNRKYTQFCYTLQYLAGKTTYLDTPVLPIAAFASVEKNPLDCECQDKTPAIYSATHNVAGTGDVGPWVPAAGGTLKIVSAGPVDVPNPAYDPTVAGSQKLITRDYGFGSVPGNVKLGSTVLSLVGEWNANILAVNVPAGAATGQQLTITRGDSGKESVVGLTVHVGGSAPIVVKPGNSIQSVIDSASTAPGALVTIPPGTYNEYVILDKRIRLQGWGAASVTINAAKANSGGLAAWRALLAKKIDARPSVPPVIDPDTGQNTINPGPNRTFDILPGQVLGFNPANNEPVLFGAEEGPGILAVGRANANGNTCANAGVAFRIDGLTITGADSGGGILASGYNCNLAVSNNRLLGNYGTYGGGVRIGHTDLANGDVVTDGVNRGVSIHHNWISQNGATEAGGGGGLTLGNGSNNYVVTRNTICGNFSMADGGGISHLGQSGGTNTISNNKIVLNQTFNQSADSTGGGLFIGGQVPAGGGASEGTGDVNVDANLIQYNNAGAGAGGGVSIARTVNGDDVVLTNNMIVNNAAAYAGGGVAVANAQGVRVVNNTVASNASTATNRQSFPPGPKVQSTAQVAGIVRLAGPSPTLLNNIVWGNRSFTWSITPADPNLPQTTTLADQGVWDLGVVGNTSHAALPSTNSVLSASAGNSTDNNNVLANAADVAFVAPINFTPLTDPDQPIVFAGTTIMQTALTFDEGGNFINVIFSPLTLWNPDGTLRADYHIKSTSIAIDKGANRNAANRVPTQDYDAQARPSPGVDAGADEFVPIPSITLSPSPFAFGNQSQNTTRTMSLNVTNTGTFAVSLTAPALTGSNANQFGFSNVDCPIGGSLNTGASCTINTSFTPTSNGAKTATLTVNSSNAGSAAVTLSGTGVSPLYAVTPLLHGYGNQEVGTASAPFAYTLTNQPASPGNLVLTGGDAVVGAQFAAAAGGTCAAGLSLSPGQSCTMNVTFNPTSTGTKLAVVNVSLAPGATGLPAAALGTGVVPSLAIACSTAPGCTGSGAYTFGTVGMTATATFTVTNSQGAAPFVIGAIAVPKTNAGAGNYAVTGGTCAVGATLAGSSCTVIVQFSSPTASTTTATLSVSGTGAGGVGAYSVSRTMTGN